MIGRALRGEVLKVFGNGKFMRDYCYVRDYIDAFVLAGESVNTDKGIFILGSGEGREFNEVVEKIREIVVKLNGREVKIEHVEFPDNNEMNKRNFVANISKFRNATGWYPKVGFDEGLIRTIEFYYNKMKEEYT